MKRKTKIIVWSLGALVVGFFIAGLYVADKFSSKMPSIRNFEEESGVKDENASNKNTSALNETNANETNVNETNKNETNANETNKNETNKNETNAKDAVNHEKTYLGSWEIVRRIQTSNVSAMGNNEAKEILGQQIIYDEDMVFEQGMRIIKAPFYKTFALSREAFESDFKGATFKKLGIDRDEVTKVEIYQDAGYTQRTYTIASNFMILDENTLIVSYEGAFFELKKENRSTYSNLEEIKALLGKEKSFIQSQFNGQYVIEPGFDGIEAYHFKEKGINLYFNNEIVDTVQVVHPLVEVKGTSLISDEQDLIEKNSSFDSTMGRNEMTNFRYISYRIEDIQVQYDIDENGDVIGIWVRKNNPM